jgi:transcriptional regulator with XRE-family HTH domain
MELMPQSLLPLGEAIKAQREKLGLSQEKLAEHCGFDRTYISMLERGKRNPSLLNLLKLAGGLKTSVSRLTKVYDGPQTTR